MAMPCVFVIVGMYVHISIHIAMCVCTYLVAFFYYKNGTRNYGRNSKSKTSALSLRTREQISQPIYPGRCSHTLRSTLHNSNIVSLSQWFTQPVHQAGIFFWRIFFFISASRKVRDDTSKWLCAGFKPTTSRAHDTQSCKVTKKPEWDFTKHLSNQTGQIVTHWYL